MADQDQTSTTEDQPPEEQRHVAEPLPADLADLVGGAIVEGCVVGGDLRLTIRRDDWRDIAEYLLLSQDHAYTFFEALSVVDYEDRFELVCHLRNLDRNRLATIRTVLDHDDPAAESLTGLWSGADWYEREAFDLFGIRFEGHPNLTRLLMPDDWEGHPLRKDYQLPDDPLIVELPEHDLAARRAAASQPQPESPADDSDHA